jgi:hypothetical protein
LERHIQVETQGLVVRTPKIVEPGARHLRPKLKRAGVPCLWSRWGFPLQAKLRPQMC